MKIHNQFSGGNIILTEIIGNDIYLENELKDTTIDWFYWAFCVEGAEGRELTFHLGKTRLGYWGPAVSHDLKEWHWLDSEDGTSFTYKFGDDESRVYFAHHILYRPERFGKFAKEMGVALSELTKTRKGRTVPYLKLGDGKKVIFLTARHHACESTGSYVLEGVLKSLISRPIEDTTVIAVPFVDYDGVLDADQGKSRAPHDHNRDYTDSPIYPEVAAICALMSDVGCNFGFDFHSPWHRGGENDNVFVVRNAPEKTEKFDRFAGILEKSITQGSMSYKSSNDHPPCRGWNQPSTSFSYTTNQRTECDLAFTLETAYFGTQENKVTKERLLALGECFADAIRKYIKSTN